MFIDCEIVQETKKACLIQQFHSSGSDPSTSARTFWVPKSCITERKRDGVVIKKWFVATKNLWSWAK